jgi:hypothetical protein
MNYLWIIILLAIIILGILFSYDSIIEGLENNELTSIKETIQTKEEALKLKKKKHNNIRNQMKQNRQKINKLKKGQGGYKFLNNAIKTQQKEIKQLNIEIQEDNKELDELNEMVLEINKSETTPLDNEILVLDNTLSAPVDKTTPPSNILATPVNKITQTDTSAEQEYDIPSYEIQLDEEGKYDPSQFEDYIDEEQITKTTTDDGIAWVKDKDGNMIALKDDGTSWIKDEEGNMVPLNPADKLSNNINYYEPGTYKYGSSSYIPTYEDSILLSKTTGKSTVSEFIDEKSIKSGICTHYKDQPDKLEEECGKLDTNVCSSTDCCVLFGGSKCIAGNAQGPISKLHYGDITIRNRDFYYYKGKCYGNCVK